MPRKILITGVAHGLGRYLAMQLHASGYAVIGVGRTAQADLEPAVRDTLADYHAFDLSHVDVLGKFSEEIFQKHADLDTVINNAGLKAHGEFVEMDDVYIRNVCAVNLIAPLIITKAFGRCRTRGYVLNIGSNAGFRGRKTSALYSATKVALNPFAEALTAAWPGIRVHTLAPSTIHFPEETTITQAKKRRRVEAKRLFEIVVNIIEKRKAYPPVIPVLSFRARVRLLLFGFLRLFR